ncbi:hypothetical protein GCM10009665_32940 [Kitasatospora nipponensis]|uniref:Ricin-type beta-trefoil lectin protein n=1 Tax=Kitasatospora nipponensis TaxID=258049 RepID=A0ABP4H137_9ACTN
MLGSKTLKAVLLVAALPAMTIGITGSATADASVTWRNGAANGSQEQGRYLYGQAGGGDVGLYDGGGWRDVLNTDGSWNEIDTFGRCLTGYGQHAYTENCNSGKDATNWYERWREIPANGGGWKLQNVMSGYFLDWAGDQNNTGPGSVYVNPTDWNNQNQRWY